jgi:hypothetical protein
MGEKVAASDPRIIAYQVLLDLIRPILAGHEPHIQGIVLADLLAYWLAGHPEETREGILKLHLEAVEDLVEFNVREIRGDA